MNTEIADQLAAYFVPVVQRELSSLTVDIKVALEFMEHLGDIEMWHVVVAFETLDLATVMSISEHLQKYWGCEDINLRLSDGRLASLGDGDDMSAAWLEGNAFRIWLRVWAKDQDYG